MRLPVDQVPPKVLDGIRARMLRLLRASPFRSPRTWARAVVVITPGRAEVLHRMTFASELREGGLDAAAHEVAVRRVGAGEVLAYALFNHAEAAGVAFVVIDVLGGAA